MILAGRASPQFAARLGKAWDMPVAETDLRTFPDGEVYARIMDSADDTVIVQSTASNDAILELILLIDAAREAGSKHVTAVVPYFGYARQDRAFRPGEAVSSRAVLRALHVDKLITVDPHKESILDFFPGESVSTSAVPLLADQLAAWGVDIILAPDKGAKDRAQRAAAHLDLPSDYLEKTRLGPTEVVMKAKDLDVDGMRVAILDDMIASGGTMKTAAAQLKDQGASKVYAACTHGVFTGGAVPKLLASGIDRVLCTDTIEGAECDVVSAADCLQAK